MASTVKLTVALKLIKHVPEQLLLINREAMLVLEDHLCQKKEPQYNFPFHLFPPFPCILFHYSILRSSLFSAKKILEWVLTKRIIYFSNAILFCSNSFEGFKGGALLFTSLCYWIIWKMAETKGGRSFRNIGKTFGKTNRKLWKVFFLSLYPFFNL